MGFGTSVPTTKSRDWNREKPGDLTRKSRRGDREIVLGANLKESVRLAVVGEKV